ncbi:MAG: saccharopine dehydrogenase family protein [Planctomycetota bacterium]
MTDAIVLGAGMVGSVMAADLAADPGFRVSIADRSPDALAAARDRAGGGIELIEADLSDAAALRRVIEPFDIVLGALASRIGYMALQAVIEAGKPYCDISFMPENALDLDEAARAAGVTAVVDCGVAPGISNLLAGHAAAQLDPCESIEIYVGGLPRERRWPFQYKAGFAPHDVIEEYTRPSRLVEHGQIVVREALSEPELLDFAGVGTLEAFNTDGLRSLVHTLDVPFMKEKTLRYPGHIELMRVFRETGLFGQVPVGVAGGAVRPLDVTAALLFPKWTYEPGEEDLTVMRVSATGEREGGRVRLSWDLLDHFDRGSQATSMSRTTALPCTIMARLLVEGAFVRPGVCAPEIVGQDARLVDRMLEALRGRGITYEARAESIPMQPPG